jgi:putative membrane protein
VLKLALVWLINALSLLTVAYVMPGIEVASFWTAMVAAVVLGLVNAFLRPVLILLTLPATVLTLGLFIFVINGLLFWLVGTHLQGFSVSGFWPAFFGAMVYSVVSWALASVVLPVHGSKAETS